MFDFVWEYQGNLPIVALIYVERFCLHNPTMYSSDSLLYQKKKNLPLLDGCPKPNT